MYQITAHNGNVAVMLHDYSITESQNKLTTAKIVTAVNAIDSLTFDIYPNNDGYAILQPFSTIVKAYNALKNRYDFVGRVLSVTPTMDASGKVYKSVTCEGRIAYLCDSLQNYVALTLYDGDANRTGVEEFIDVLLDQHNAQMPADKKIYRGNITIGESENVYAAIEYACTYDTIKSKLLDNIGGELRIRDDSGTLYLDYAEQFGTTRATEIAVSRNMQTAKRAMDATNIITRLIPLGHKLTTTETSVDENGQETTTETEIEERLNISSVNDGINYVEDSTAVDLFGVIYGYQIWDDVTLPLNLKSKGVAWLSANNTLSVTNTITALDLSLIGLDIDDFICGDSYPVKNSLIGLNDTLRIIKKSTDCIMPQKSTFDMGNKALNLSDFVISDNLNIVDIADMVSKNQSTVNNITNNIITTIDRRNSSAIKQSESAIIAEVAETTVSKSDYSTFTDNVKNVLAMDADGTTMIFTNISQSITDINGQVQSDHAELTKYIRFEDGNIILGQEGNEITLTIQNNRISFKQNGNEVAYLSDNNLYIGNAVIQDGGRLQIGNFAFVPRSDGSMSLLKVGG